MKTLWSIVAILSLGSVCFADITVSSEKPIVANGGQTPQASRDLPSCIQDVKKENPKLSPFPWNDHNPWVDKLKGCTKNEALHASPALQNAVLEKLDRITMAASLGCVCWKRVGGANSNTYTRVGPLDKLSTHENCVGMGGHICF